MPGTVTAVLVTAGEQVRAGQPLVVLEAMKMEHSLVAPTDGVVDAMFAKIGEVVEDGKKLAVVREGISLQQLVDGLNALGIGPRDMITILQAIKAAGCQAGLVFNPAEPLDVLDWLIEDIDLVLIMSVNPGFGGQGFIDSALRKVEHAAKRIQASGRDIRLEVDGGIKPDNIRSVADAGADTFVAGSAIFGKPDYKKVIEQMRQALAG